MEQGRRQRQGTDGKKSRKETVERKGWDKTGGKNRERVERVKT